MQHPNRLMTRLGIALTFFLASAMAEAAGPLDFDGCKWIWYTPGIEAALGELPAGVPYLRTSLTVPDDARVVSAEAIATCDNLFVLYLNGVPVGESDAGNSVWSQPKRWDVAGHIASGKKNTVAIQAVNTLPGPAGLIFKLVVRLSDGREMALPSDATWRSESTEHPSWQSPDFDDSHWGDARVVGQYGDQPWRKVRIPDRALPAGTPIGEVARFAKDALQEAARQQRVAAVVELVPGADFAWPPAIAFVGDDRSLYRPLTHTASSRDSLNVTIFNPRNSRAFPEHDLPAPMKVGRLLYLVDTPGPGARPRVLLDARRGALGSPSPAYDGKSILVSMAFDGDSFFHVYRVPVAGGTPTRLTDGPFHDIDPVELPDGRIVFTSTRIGTFEEYHNPPSRSLFVMDADGTGARPLTSTIIFDNEPEVLADGRIVFVRSDNFFDRGKVETLLHAIHPDGIHGYTEIGLNISPDYGSRLRAFHCGSPAPMPDGRLAFVSGPGITIGRLGSLDADQAHLRVPAGDLAPIPDGRLLCTTARLVEVQVGAANARQAVNDIRYEQVCVVDPDAQPPTIATVFDSPNSPIHSPICVAARVRPPALAETVEPVSAPGVRRTGVLYSQSARFTQKTTAGWTHVRAIRVLAGTGLTTRSSHSYIVHAGNETVELGTVPLAPDGSFAVEVPADTPIALQAVDAEGRSELNEMSWIYVRPGERRGCVGCHHKRQAAPLYATTMPLALRTRPLRLSGQGEPHRFRGNNAAVTGLMEMQLDRYREVAGINRHPRTDDPLISGKDDVAGLLAVLADGDDDHRITAAQRLAIFRDPAAAAPLASSLKSANRELRVAAAVALAACGTRDSVRPLLDALADSDPLVAQAAAMALENLTGHAEPLDPFARASDRERQVAAWRLWFDRIGWDAIESRLVEGIASADRDVVRRAAVALSHIGSTASHEPLRQYLLAQRGINPLPEWQQAHRGDGARFNSLDAVNPRTLQAATRAIGSLKDAGAVPILAETLAMHNNPDSGNLFLAEAAIEALGRIGTPEAEAELVRALAALRPYPDFTQWYGDHGALMACHASPPHYLILEALDSMGSRAAGPIVTHLLRSVPIDPDRALLLESDDYEQLVGRLVRRTGAEEAVVETCLAVLGEEGLQPDGQIAAALETIRCWAGHPTPENRAAQVLSFVCRDLRYAPRIRHAFERYREMPCSIPRVFDTGIPVVLELPVKNWVCFYLARTLGNMADRDATELLIASLRDTPPEGASGRPDPLGPGVLFLHNDLTPCWRAAVAWTLGRLGDRRSVEVLLEVAGDLENATDTRHAASRALGQIAAPEPAERLRQLAEDYPEVSVGRALSEAAGKCERRGTLMGMAGE
ncbi:MAG: HEAT repeat domain-containing protein [Thermoguttaceae bacterium]